MDSIEKISSCLPPRIGLYSAGLSVYWDQFAGLLDCLNGYNAFLERRLSAWGTVFNFGMVDSAERGRAAGEYFNANHVDLIFVHSATYFTSGSLLPVHQLCKAPAVVLNLQPAASMDYGGTGTDRWLAQCVACPIPECANAFQRANIPFRVVSGLLGLEKTPPYALADEATSCRPEAVAAWREIGEWCAAARVKRALQSSRFGFLGGYYSGMLDLYSDFTMLQGQTGITIELLEMCDLAAYMRRVTPEQLAQKERQVKRFFSIAGDSPSDPLAKKPTPAQLDWAIRVAAAQEQLVRAYRLDALAYYYHGREQSEYEKLQGGFIVGHSLLTAAGVPCSGEADIKTALAMKICDILGKGGSFCEIVASDFDRSTIIIGHDGPFHIAIAQERPVLRGMGAYHGKRGSGVSVEARVRPGPVTTLGLTQTADGHLKLNISEGAAVDAPTLMNGNTSTHVRFSLPPAEYMQNWFAQAPTHHAALSVGHNAGLFIKTAQILGLPYAVF